MNVQELFKLDRQMTQIEAQWLIFSAILSFAESGQSIQPGALVNAESCAVQLGITKNRETFRKINRDTFPAIANTIVNRMMQFGILEHDWVSGTFGSVYKLNPTRIESLQTLTTLEGLATAEFVETLQDDVLRTRCEFMVINAGSPDTLIREAATVLEDRLRNFVEGPIERRNLPGKVLNPDTGTMNKIFSKDRQLDLFHLVRGVLGLYGTPAHHGLQEDIMPQTATRIVAIIDEILLTLSAPSD